jgi:hypothetical protein
MPRADGRPTYEEWLQSQIQGGRFQQNSDDKVVRNKFFSQGGLGLNPMDILNGKWLQPGVITGYSTEELQGLYNGEVGAEDPEAAKAKAAKDDIDANIKAYYEQLSRPIDQNDPYVKAVIQTAFNSGSGQAKLAGIEGGLSTQNALEAAGKAGMQLEGQRLDRLGSALGMASSRDLDGRQLAEDQHRFDMQQRANSWQQGQANAQAGGAQLGGLAGAVFGGLTMGPAGVGTGYQFGSQFGGGTGGLSFSNSNPYPSSGRGYGGFGNTRGGNGY